MTVGGVFLCAIAVGFFKCSLFGVDPFQCFAQETWGHFFEGRLSYGAYYAVLSAVMLVADLFLDRHYIGIATFINMFLFGYVVVWAVNLINQFFPAPSLRGESKEDTSGCRKIRRK